MALVVALGVFLVSMRVGASAHQARALAEQEAGEGYRFHISWLSRVRTGTVSQVSAMVIAWNDNEMRRIPDPFPETLLEIEGPKGSVVVSRGERLSVTTDGLVFEEAAGAPLLPWTTRPWHVSQEAVRHANAHFLAAFRAGRPAETSGEDNLRTYALAEAAYEAAATHAAVRPKA